MGKKNELSIVRTIRIEEGLDFVVEKTRKEMGIDRTDFYKLALIELMLKIPNDNTYKDINFKEYLEYLQLEKLRSYEKLGRNEIKSGHFFKDRVLQDIQLYISYGKSREDVLQILNQYKKEAKHYKSKIPLEQTEYIINLVKNSKDHELSHEIRTFLMKLRNDRHLVLEMKKHKESNKK